MSLSANDTITNQIVTHHVTIHHRDTRAERPFGVGQGWRVSNSNRAGASTQTMYDELTKSWRRRNRKFFIALGGLCGLVAALSFIAARPFPQGSWFLGLLAGAAVTFFTLVRASPPGWMENWQLGAWGEEATGKVLANLDSAQWSVLHGIKTDHGNVDHIVVGPGGVFVLDSKRPGGLVSVDAGVVRVERPDDADLSYIHRGPAGVRRLAAETSQRLLDATRIRQWVTPVMVVWAEFPQRVVEGDSIVIHGDALIAWLQSQPAQIAPVNVPRIAEAVRTAWVR